MSRTYVIRHGQQFDPQGAHVLHGSLMTSYRRDGRRSHGELVRSDDAEAVHAAVLRVVEHGGTETLVLGEPAVPVALADDNIPAECPHWTAEQGCPLHGELCSPDRAWAQ